MSLSAFESGETSGTTGEGGVEGSGFGFEGFRKAAGQCLQFLRPFFRRLRRSPLRCSLLLPQFEREAGELVLEFFNAQFGRRQFFLLHPTLLGEGAGGGSEFGFALLAVAISTQLLDIELSQPIIAAIILPPLATFLKKGAGMDLVINIVLTLLGYLPGIIHALWLILKSD